MLARIWILPRPIGSVRGAFGYAANPEARQIDHMGADANSKDWGQAKGIDHKLQHARRSSNCFGGSSTHNVQPCLVEKARRTGSCDVTQNRPCLRSVMMSAGPGPKTSKVGSELRVHNVQYLLNELIRLKTSERAFSVQLGLASMSPGFATPQFRCKFRLCASQAHPHTAKWEFPKIWQTSVGPIKAMSNQSNLGSLALRSFQIEPEGHCARRLSHQQHSAGILGGTRTS